MNDPAALYDAEVAYQPAPASRRTAVRSAPADHRALLEIANLRIRFGPDAPAVVRGVSLTVHRGECLALIGESGSGKSVTSRTLVGLTGAGAIIEADRLSFAEENLLRCTPRRWRSLRGGRIGFVMQDALGSLDPLRRIGTELDEALALHTPLDRTHRAARTVELLAATGVPEPAMRARQYPHQLSGGLRQRALVACGIACDPDLLIADEPTTALDAGVQAQVLDLLGSLRTADNAMIVVSHDFAVVSRLADTVAVMHRGQIVEKGPVEAVLRSPKHPYTRSLLEAVRTVHQRGGASPSSPAVSTVSAPPRGAMPAIALEVRDLSKSFPGSDGRDRTVVNRASLTLSSAETLAIVGESGSGKTTLLRLILGLERPDTGEIRLQGRSMQELSATDRRAARRRMQVVFQDPLASFDPRYTVARVLDEALSFAGDLSSAAARRQRARELLELVRLDGSLLPRRPIELSGGQRQRIAIARALAPKPGILVCDEPVSALDVSVQKQILDLLADLKARLGLACLFVSHDLGVVRRIADRVIVMKDGQIVEAGTVAEVFARPIHPYTRALLAAIPALDFKAAAIHI